jgi:putative DNA primase/helicase
MSTADDLNLYLDTMFGETEGYLHVATGSGPYFNAAGKYKHEDWRQEHHRWPEEREQAVRALLADAQGADAYGCPYLMVGDKRGEGAAVDRRKAHADIDNGLADAEKIRELHGYAVGSGTKGNAHAYVDLTRSVPTIQHEALCRALGAHLGAKDSKIKDNDVLRPPGTYNHKARIRSAGGEPTPVEWLVRPDGAKWEPETLAEVLGITLPTTGVTSGAKQRGTKSTTAGAKNAGDQVNLENHPKVQAALANNTGDRSADTMRVVGACVSDKLTRAQGWWVVNSRTDLADRLAERPDDDFTECWLKAVDSRQEYARQRAAERERAMNPDGTTLTEEATKVTHSGHLGMAYKVGAQYRDKLLYVNGIGWHRWDGQRWARDGNGAARRAVHTVIKREWIACASLPAPERDERAKQISRYESASAISGILTESAALEVFSVEVKDLDSDPYLLNCANGTLDLHTLVLRPASPADRITKACRGAYTPDAAAPVWDGFLGTSLPDGPMRQFVQRLTGLALLGEVREHLLPIFTGEGANGKSTFYEGVLHTLGDYGIVAEADLFNHRENAHPTGQMDLMGRRLAVVSETDEGKRLAEATVKRLTGGDPIRARYMRENFVQFNPSHLPILVTNHLPKVSGDDPAIWRRIRVVDWTVVIPTTEQDKELSTKLQLEADGILCWCVGGLRDYLAGGLAEPDSVIRSTSKYRADSDAVARFVDEVLHKSPAVKISAADLFDAWERWRRVDGAPEVSQKALGLALSKHGLESNRSNGKTWWNGICVLKEDEQCM